jgi:RNA polymerase sigma-70 factor, ECF subfamily
MRPEISRHLDGAHGEAALHELLDSWRGGNVAALDELVADLYYDLRAISARLMARERNCLTLQPTAVVSEAYLRLRDLGPVRVASRESFLRLAARIMRHVLVDFSRAREAGKRGGDIVKVSADGFQVAAEDEALLDVLTIDRALEELEEADPRLVRQVELRVFAGLMETEVAEVLGISRATVQRDWAVAKRWLVHHLTGEGSRR